MPSIELLLGSELPPERSLEFAREAERMGLAGVWLAEDYFYAAAFSSAAAVLAATERIRVGIGVASILVRHPAVTAMEIATLGRMFPGRLIGGLGYGVPGWMAQMGLNRPSGSVQEVRERFGLIRALLEGHRVDHSSIGSTLDSVQLAFPPRAVPPLALGVSGPRMLDMAVTEADLVVLSILSGPAYIGWVRDLAAQKRSDGTAAQLVCFALAAVHEDGEHARHVARASVAGIVCRRPDSPIIKRSKHFDVITELAKGGLEHVRDNLPDECLDELAIAGTPEHCLQLIRERGDAGASSVVLLPLNQGVDDELCGVRALVALGHPSVVGAGTAGAAT